MSTSTDGIVFVWETETGNEVARVTQNNMMRSGASIASFSPDGKYVISVDEDIARIWNAAVGSDIFRIAHDGKINAINFSLDGRYVVSGGEDNTVRVWLWQSEDLTIDACSRVSRNLTRAEWEQYVGDTLSYRAVCSNLPIESK